MGFFSTSGGKKITKERFREALRRIPNLSDTERAYVDGLFQGALRKNGINEEEFEEIIRNLERDLNDSLNSEEVRDVKEKLEEYFK